MRSRIRTSYMVNGDENISIKYLHGHGHEENKEIVKCKVENNCKVVPFLALNEVSINTGFII